MLLKQQLAVPFIQQRKTLVKDRAQNLLSIIEQDIKDNKLILPSLPEVALRVRDMASSPDCSLVMLEQEVAKDASIAARLLKVANSSALQRGTPVTLLRQAIGNLGINLVRSLVTQLAILQTMQTSKDKQRLQDFVDNGLKISALSQSIASKFAHLDKETASLAGLLHDIGKLPLRDFLMQLGSFAAPERLQFEIILHPYVGALLLNHWNMPTELVQVARWHELVLRDTGRDLPDYVDVIIAANVLHYGLTEGRYQRYAGEQIPALKKCGIDQNAELEPGQNTNMELANTLAAL